MTNLDILQLIKSLGDQVPPTGSDTDVIAYRQALAARPRQSSEQTVDFVLDDHVSTGQDVIPVRYYRHGNAIDAQPTLIYFHGGGFVSGTLDTHDSICRRLARDTGWIIVSVDYRLAPEHPYPAAVDDGLAVVAWLAAGGAATHGLDIGAIALGGDSAGGAIAAVVASRACKTVALAHLLLIYPVLDTDFETASYREYGTGYLLTTNAMRWFWDHYLGGSSAPTSAVPARADMSGLPPNHDPRCGSRPLARRSQSLCRKARAGSDPRSLSLCCEWLPRLSVEAGARHFSSKFPFSGRKPPQQQMKACHHDFAKC